MNTQQFLDDVWTGLAQKQKTLPCKYFYDERGSRLFEQICELQEYYLTRTEIALLKNVRDEMAAIIGKNAQVIEPGSGASIKIKLLIGALDAPVSYVPFEISTQILGRSSQEVADAFPHITVQPISGDFTQPINIPPPPAGRINGWGYRKVIFFPGSTIGNFAPDGAKALLQHFAALAGSRGMIFVGVDRVKPHHILEKAYDDDLGVTEAFNKNILHRINRELDGQIDADNGFRHRAYFNEQLSRIEMHLVSALDQTINVGGKSFRLSAGETIHTENSYKYYPDHFVSLANDAGLKTVQHWSDESESFSIFCLSN